MDVRAILKDIIDQKASDLFIVAGASLKIKIEGKIVNYDDLILTPNDSRQIIEEIYQIAGNRDFHHFLNTGDDDFSFSLTKIGRFRVNAYLQRNSCAAVLRIVSFELPDYQLLHIPKTVSNLAKENKGLILVAGPAGSGKSTTLACLIDLINQKRNCHIITIEDPIEYLHRHHQSIVSQREVYHDTLSYITALKAALREAPEVILVGEMRDLETMEIVITASETGHLVFSSLHTITASNTIDRMIDVFPPSKQQQIRIQLAMVLNAVVCQQLLPGKDGKMIPAFEIMICNQAIRTLIRDGKTHQIDNAIISGHNQGMISMDEAILALYQQNLITKETALMYAINVKMMEKKIGGNNG